MLLLKLESHGRTLTRKMVPLLSQLLPEVMDSVHLTKLLLKAVMSVLGAAVFPCPGQVKLVLDDLTKLQSKAWRQVLSCPTESSSPLLQQLGPGLYKELHCKQIIR